MVNLGVNLLGILIFLFIFWKMLKEDYVGEIIFSSSSFILLGIFVGYILSLRFIPPWFFWLEFIGAIFGLLISINRFKVRFYEAMEASLVGLLPWLGLTFLLDSITSSSLVSFIAFLTCLALIFFYYFLNLKYKSFSWYRSGKIGFSGLSVLGIIFLIRSSVAIFLIPVLSFVGKAEVFVSGSLAFTAFLLIFNLARKEV